VTLHDYTWLVLSCVRIILSFTVHPVSRRLTYVDIHLQGSYCPDRGASPSHLILWKTDTRLHTTVTGNRQLSLRATYSSSTCHLDFRYRGGDGLVISRDVPSAATSKPNAQIKVPRSSPQSRSKRWVGGEFRALGRDRGGTGHHNVQFFRSQNGHLIVTCSPLLRFHGLGRIMRALRSISRGLMKFYAYGAILGPKWAEISGMLIREFSQLHCARNSPWLTCSMSLRASWGNNSVANRAWAGHVAWWVIDYFQWFCIDAWNPGLLGSRLQAWCTNCK